MAESFDGFLRRREEASNDYIRGDVKALVGMLTTRDPATFMPPSGAVVQRAEPEWSTSTWPVLPGPKASAPCTWAFRTGSARCTTAPLGGMKVAGSRDPHAAQRCGGAARRVGADRPGAGH